jgi:hypothetical protein
MLYLKKRVILEFMQINIINTVKSYANFYTKEKDLYQVWINFCKQRTNLVDIKLKGIYSGILNESEGPDFQGAEFEFNGKIFRGDVEIHRHCVDWSRHGHHLDSHYDRVVLHLVMGKQLYPVYNSKNQIIPSISLLSFPVPVNNSECLKNCNFNFSDQSFPLFLFQTLALQRLTNKANEIYKLISTYGLDQSLYFFILRSLGNVVNKNNYERLAQLIPWKLVQFLKDKNNPPEYWIALYNGSAGLITEKSNSDVQRYWKNCLPLIEGTKINKESWKLGGIRPYNYPQNRLTGLALFIWQMKEPSIFNVLEQLFYKRSSTSEFIEKLISIFTVDKNLLQHFKIINQASFWGRNLIIELTGNVFIPIFYKIATLKKSYGFEMYLKQLFLELPLTQKYGKLDSLISRLHISNSISNHFYLYQALLHLQNAYCSFNNFTECPLQTFKQKN